jgi:tetratricopeptide (TPR) repeat protein
VRRPCLLALALAVALGLASGSEPAGAQGYGGAPEAPADTDVGKKDGEPEKPKRTWGKRNKQKLGKSQTVRERTGKRLNTAYEQIQAEQWALAEAELQKLRLGSLNPLERAKYHQIYALIENGRKNPQGARDHLQQALAQEAFSPADQAQTRYQIAGLFLGESKWKEAVDNLNEWFAVTESPTPAAYYLLALAHYQMQDLDNAREAAEKAIEIGNPPQEGALQLLLAILLTNQHYAEAEPVLLELVERYPKKIYWSQLSTLYGAQGDYEKALVYLELANLQGYLTQDEEVRRLTQLLLARDLPYPAAQLLEKAFEEKRIDTDANSFELLSTAWIQARDFDKALPPLRKAAELSTDGKLYIRLAQVHLQREELDAAETALQRAIEKGGLASPGDAQLLMGITVFGQKRPEQALAWFERARVHAETREEAEIWVKHIQQQMPSLAATDAPAASN